MLMQFLALVGAQERLLHYVKPTKNFTLKLSLGRQWHTQNFNKGGGGGAQGALVFAIKRLHCISSHCTYY